MASSLKEFDRIADRIKLARQQDRRPVAVVEGRTDRNFLNRVLPDIAIEYYIGGTRSVVLETAVEVEALGVSRVACIVDRDFDDEVAAIESATSSVATYDNADLEAMLWSSQSLDLLIEEVGSKEKLAKYGGVGALRIQTREVLRPLSKLREANAERAWGLNFDGLDLAGKLDLRTLTLSVQAICDSLWSHELDVPKAELYAVAESVGTGRKCPCSGDELIRGRDALAVVGVALRRILGNLSHQQAAVDRLEETLRLTATARSIEGSNWLVTVTSLLAEAS